MYSKQVIYCNACGAKLEMELPNVIGREFRCCSPECVKEMEWRATLSILGVEYYPRKKEEENG